ncbi:MAG TPA: ATP-binding protein [Candidatus Dormibacteraeota bacterium]|nr:ATP-binding protein [Candidatus Dormibacteraeota bacterium]
MAVLAVVAALLACVASADAARRLGGRARVAWSLLAAAAASWAVASFAIPAYAVAALLALAGLLALPSAPSGIIDRLRAVLDGMVLATTLVLVWSFGLGALYTRIPTLSTAVALPAADVVLIVVGAIAFLRARAGSRQALGGVVAALAVMLTADGAGAYEPVMQGGPGGLVGEIGRIAAYGILTLASLRAGRSEAEPALSQTPPELWQVAIPWVGAGTAVAVNFVYVLAGRLIEPAMLGISCGIGALFVLSQILAMSESLDWLAASRRAERQLRDRTNLLDEVINRAPLGIARVDDNFRFLDVNPRLSQMLAVPIQGLVGTSVAQYIPEVEVARARERMALMKAGRLDRVEVDGEMRCADGRTLYVHRSVTPVFGSGGRISYYLVMFEDITARHDAEQAAAGNLAAVERLNRLKSEFMSLVSHEFRTALTGIQGYSEVLHTQDVSPDEVKQFAGDINADAMRLNRMITDMLDLDRIEAGRIQLHVESVDLHALITAAVDRARMTTDKHEIRTELHPGCVSVQGDADRLMQVVINLLNNAIKYSPEGGEIVVQTTAENGRVEVAVRDQGEGIPPEFLPRLFSRYERYEGAGRSRAVGTGLGLAIAQQIIQLHRGRIWVESRVGEGSTFRFTLPADIPQSEGRPVSQG